MLRLVEAQGHKYDDDCKRLWVQFPFEEIKYLIFSFHRSGSDVKRGIKLRHATPPEFYGKCETKVS